MSQFSKIAISKLFMLVASFLLMDLDLITPPLEAYVSEATFEGIGLYATARSINAAISVLQTVQVSVVVSTVSIGEVLDPLNDAIERFSTVLSWSIGALVAQNFGLEIVRIGQLGAMVLIVGLTSISLTSISYFSFLRPWIPLDTDRWGHILWRSFLVLFYLRLTLPVAIAFSMWMTNAVVQQHLEIQAEIIENSNDRIVRLKDKILQPNDADPAVISKIREDISKVKKSIDQKNGNREEIVKKLEAYQSQLDGFRLPTWLPFVNGNETEVKLNEEIYSITQEIENDQSHLEELKHSLECQNLAAKGEDCRGIFERIKGADLTVLKDLTSLVSDASEALLMLISAIVLKTIILPLLTVWAVLKAMKPTIGSLASSLPVALLRPQSEHTIPPGGGKSANARKPIKVPKSGNGDGT